MAILIIPMRDKHSRPCDTCRAISASAGDDPLDIEPGDNWIIDEAANRLDEPTIVPACWAHAALLSNANPQLGQVFTMMALAVPEAE